MVGASQEPASALYAALIIILKKETLMEIRNLTANLALKVTPLSQDLLASILAKQ